MTHHPHIVGHSVCSGVRTSAGGRVPTPSVRGYLHIHCTSWTMHRCWLYGQEKEGKEKSDGSRLLLGDNVPTSERAFWDIFGGSKLQNRGSTVHHKLNSTSKPSLSILSAPPHVLPPMLSLCLPFLQSLLTHRQGSKGHLDEDMAESEVGDLFRGRRSARSGCGL
ncbi:uncharacterized protein LOC135348489 [Halichondria panicea]|uniref:uncharacterized protein LOC135348489 n=1 Tax=Halichondria panicea TaxID=6063 RepID=UPI00312B73D2